MPTPVAAPPTPPGQLFVVFPPRAPTTTAIPAIDPQFVSVLQRYVSPPSLPTPPPAPTLIPIVVPAVRATFETFAYAPPPPAPNRMIAPPPPPPPTVSIVFVELQSLGTVHVVPDVRNTRHCPPPISVPAPHVVANASCGIASAISMKRGVVRQNKNTRSIVPCVFASREDFI